MTQVRLTAVNEWRYMHCIALWKTSLWWRFRCEGDGTCMHCISVWMTSCWLHFRWRGWWRRAGVTARSGWRDSWCLTPWTPTTGTTSWIRTATNGWVAFTILPSLRPAHPYMATFRLPTSLHDPVGIILHLALPCKWKWIPNVHTCELHSPEVKNCTLRYEQSCVKLQWAFSPVTVLSIIFSAS